MARPRHPNKEIEAAVAHAETLGWRVVPISGHAWGGSTALGLTRTVAWSRCGARRAMRRTMPRLYDGMWRGARTGKRSE
jgi:hypothetical protein